MASESVFTFTDDNFDEAALRSDVPAVVDFWGPQCSPCLMLAPIIDKLSDDYAGRVKIGKLNTNDYTGKAIDYGIQAIPHVLLIKNGEVVGQIRGLMPEKIYVEEIEKLLA